MNTAIAKIRRHSAICPLLAVSVYCIAVAFPEQVVKTERDIVVARLTSVYGRPIEGESLQIPIAEDYVLRPTFSYEGALIAVSIEPRGASLLTAPQLKNGDYQSILVDLDSIKRIGRLEEDQGGADRDGWRIRRTKRFKNAYITTSEWQLGHAIESATIYYMHPLTSMFRIPRGSRPEGTNSFDLVCANGYGYRSPRLDMAKVAWSPHHQRTLNVAGPIGGKIPECEE